MALRDGGQVGASGRMYVMSKICYAMYFGRDGSLVTKKT